MNVYRATFDLVVEDLTVGGYVKHVVTDAEPVADRVLVARDFDAAYLIARQLQGTLRRGAVHQTCVVRSIELLHADVVTAETAQAQVVS